VRAGRGVARRRIVLVDELVKENYGFDINDLVSPSITHEKIFLMLLLTDLLLGLRWRRGG
jgi:hypothetical protein